MVEGVQQGSVLVGTFFTTQEQTNTSNHFLFLPVKRDQG